MARVVAPPPKDKKRLCREAGPGERWWFGLLLVPAALTGLLVMSDGHTIESRLERDTSAALRDAGLPGTEVRFAGRKATVKVPTGESKEKALQVATRVTGVSDVYVEHVARNMAEERACADLQAKIDAAMKNHGIEFAGGGATMTVAAGSAVHTVARLLLKCPSATVIAEGHTDSTVLQGSTISLRRAEVVRSALGRDGVKGARVRTRGYGDTFPVDSNETTAGRTRNNRVSITVSED